MLKLFSKFQKLVLLIAAFSVVASGLGYTLGTLAHRSEQRPSSFEVQSNEIELIGLNHEYYRALLKFLSYEAIPFTGQFNEWNFLNPGLVSEYILGTDIGKILFLQTYQDGFSAFAQEQQYRPYSRSDAPFISAKDVWQNSSPKILELLEKLQKTENPVSEEGYAVRVALFMEEKKFPHTLLRQILDYRSRLFKLPPDVSLHRGYDLHLFGYHHLGEWFGMEFMQKVALLVHDVVNKATVNIPVSMAKNAMMEQIDQLLAKSHPDIRGTWTRETLFREYCHFLGVSENVCLQVYRDVMVFIEVMNQLRGGVAFDFSPFKEFVMQANDAMEVELYTLPKDCVFTKEDDIIHFERYLSLISQSDREIGQLPDKIRSISTIKQQYPELVGRRLVLSYDHVDLHDVIKQIPIADIIKWQQDHFYEMRKELPELQKISSLKELVLLSEKEKNAVDNYTKRAIIHDQPIYVEKALSQAKRITKEVFLATGVSQTLAGILHEEDLLESLLDNEELIGYTQDHEHFYTFSVQQCMEEEILQFHEVKARQLCSKLEKYVAAVDIRARFAPMCNEYGKQAPAMWLSHLLHSQKNQQLIAQANHPIIRSLLPTKTIRTIYRKDAGFTQAFQPSQCTEGYVSQIFYSKEDGPCYYRVLRYTSHDGLASSDALLYIKNYLDHHICADYLSCFIRG